MPTAFVLAGGGSLGAVQAGMLVEVLTAGIRPDLIVGVSAGAINGAYLAADPVAQRAEQLVSLWSGLRTRDVLGTRLLVTLRMLGARPALASPQPLRLLLSRSLPYQRIEAARTKLCLVASDQHTGEEVVMQDGDLVDAVLASAAIPGVFPPVQIGNRSLIDGVIASGTPISTAVRLGADRLIVMPCGFTCVGTAIPRRSIGRAIHALTLIAAQRLRAEFERHRDLVSIRIVPPLCPLARSAHDYSGGAELIRTARESTRAWLDGGGLDRCELPHEIKDHVH